MVGFYGQRKIRMVEFVRRVALLTVVVTVVDVQWLCDWTTTIVDLTIMNNESGTLMTGIMSVSNKLMKSRTRRSTSV